MNLIIVTPDNAVGIDGKFVNIQGLSEKLPNIHAFVWNGSKGEIEFSNGTSNEKIESLGEYKAAIDSIVAEWNLLNPPAPVLTVEQVLSQLKKDQLNSLKAGYSTEVITPVDYMDTTFQPNDIAINNITNSFVELPKGFYWVDANNNKVSMSIEQLKGLSTAIATRNWELFQKLQNKKALVNDAKTAISAQKITWS